MNKFWVGFFTFLWIAVIGATLFFTLTPTGKNLFNRYDYAMNRVDEQTYKKQKEVEDTCRMYIASYTNDKLIYEQYKNSESQIEKEMSNNAKTRANTTATIYNEYILKNKYVWSNNVPSNIYMTLEYLT